MKEELLGKEVLAMYDIRGIQGYIFKTNAVKEIIGASKLVDDIIINGLKDYVKNCVSPEEKDLYLVEWNNGDTADAFIKDGSKVLMQVMFVGGGNAYVLFRNGSICSEVNRYLGKYVLDKTYSLNVAIAVIEKTASYTDDYRRINMEMRRIKAHMPLSKPVGAFSFTATDSITGLPITGCDLKSVSKKYYCTESLLKRKTADTLQEKNIEKIFDNMVTQKGDNSTLALIHLDGNSLGKRIMNLMRDVKDYKTAIQKMRRLSSGIDKTFKDTFDEMTSWMDSQQDKFKTDTMKYRKIVVAGDDITFVCNAKLAIPAVKYFLEKLNEKKTDFIETEEDKNPIFTACAGIAFFNSHFPFSDAYMVAEACCDSAKKRAKSTECSISGKDQIVGNFFDFQMCTNVNASNLDDYRDKHYVTNGESIIRRPYYVSVENDKGLNAKNEKYSVTELENKLSVLCGSELPRSLGKEIRNVIPQGNNEIKKEIAFLKSRKHAGFERLEEEKGVWYDACELMDLQL